MVQKVNLYYLKYVFFLMVLYVFMYNPPLQILPVSPKYILYPLISIPLLYNKDFLRNILFLKINFLLVFVLLLYSFIREILAFKLVFFPVNVPLFIESTFLPLLLVYYYRSIKPTGDFLKEVIVVGFTASLFTVLMIFNDSVGDFIRYGLLRTDEYTESVAFRTFGFAEGLTFSYGIIQGLVLGLVLLYSDREKKYLFLIPFLFVSVLFNARIGFVPFIISFTILNFFNFNLKRILGLLSFIVLFYTLYDYTSFFDDYKTTIDWGLDFFTQSSDFVSNDSGKENTFNTLFGEMAVFPKTIIEWIFGSGENLFISTTNNSDVGYIIQLNYGGILYLSIILLIVLNMFRYCFRLNGIERIFLLIIVVTMLVANIKGNLFVPVGILRLMMLIFSIFVIKYATGKSNKTSVRINDNI